MIATWVTEASIAVELIGKNEICHLDNLLLTSNRLAVRAAVTQWGQKIVMLDTEMTHVGHLVVPPCSVLVVNMHMHS